MQTTRFDKLTMLIILATLLVLTAAAKSWACTGVEVKTTDGSVIFARTLEFGFDVKSNLLFTPRGQKFASDLGKGLTGKTWRNKHAFIGMNLVGSKHLLEGLNEKGLYVAGFFFPGFAKYLPLEAAKTDQSLNPVDLGNWLLSNFSDTGQVKQAMKTIRVVNAPFEPFGKDFVMPMHCIVVDNTGASIVLEYTNGELNIFDNPVGVITNAPTFDWHMINLRNYINLSAVNVPNLDMEHLKLKATGQGSGMLGLPGDFTPPSRFVRAVALNQSAVPVKTATQGVNLAWHIINNIDIPIGSARDVSSGGKIEYDYTQWTTVNDLTNLQIYFRTYENLTIRKVNLKDLDPNGNKVLTIPVDGVKSDFSDVTSTAK